MSLSEAFILWPLIDPPPVYETRYSYRFCLQKTKTLTGLKIIYYDPRHSLAKNFKERSFKIHPEAGFLIVTHPETVISKEAAGQLLSHLTSTNITAPVFNDTPLPSQQAALPWPYFDVFTFQEAAQNLANTFPGKERVSQIDKACFACRGSLLLSPLEEKVFSLPEKATSLEVLKGALVHLFRRSFSALREDLLALIPPNISHMLDVGCAEGGFGKLLRTRFKKSFRLEGLELSPYLAEKAKAYYDRVIIGPFEEAPLPENHYDLIHMGDVLEHLYDPWSTLERIRKLLKPGGYFTGSVPNTAHWSIINQLLHGEFEYIPLGLLCVSHIRFFTPKSLTRLFQEMGFEIELWHTTKPAPSPSGQKLIKLLSQNALADQETLLTSEILFRVCKR